ncbi:hypothetical protein AB0D49_08185 [Streptomyces sp. NPDC048290]|uniref:hypothetical protein n=1 Tax=Streptomyces sp. NPDC048290 TaxID=3155811 RepID=UPI003426CB28
MALPALATVDDLEAAGVSSSPAAMELALRRASARVRAHTRQDFTFEAGDTVLLRGGERVLVLPQRPVVVDDAHPLAVVELIDMAGVEVPAVEGRDFTRVGCELTRGYPFEAPGRSMGWPWSRTLGVWADRVRVVYSHGYAEVPDDIADIVLDLATTNLTNPNGLRSETVGGESVTYASETIGNAKLTRQHKEDLRLYRRAAFSVVAS